MARTYIVSGAASGIGKATSQLLLERGNKVIGGHPQRLHLVNAGAFFEWRDAR